MSDYDRREYTPIASTPKCDRTLRVSPRELRDSPCDTHPGWTHPFSVGQVVEAFVRGLLIVDPDGDVITALQVGAWPSWHSGDETGFRDGDEADFREWHGDITPVLTYHYAKRAEWNENIDSPHFDTWRKRCSSEVSTPRWAMWLVEDPVTDDMMEEVRKRLGMEE